MCAHRVLKLYQEIRFHSEVWYTLRTYTVFISSLRRDYTAVAVACMRVSMRAGTIDTSVYVTE